MKKKQRVLAVLTVLIMLLNVVAIQAADFTAGDLYDVNVTIGSDSVSVEYTLTQLAIDEGFGFTRTETMINGHSFNTSSFTASFADLGLAEGTTTTATYYVEASRTVVTPGDPESHKVVSSSEALVATYGDSNYSPATETWVHPLWNEIYGSLFPDSHWIWNSYYSNLPVDGEVLDFQQSFDVSATPTGSAILTIVADNGFQAILNGNIVGTSSGLSGDWMTPPVLDSEVNPQAWKTNLQSIPVNVMPGNNTLEVVAINEYQGNATPKSNPGGLIYQLEYSTEGSGNAEPEQYGDEGSFDIVINNPEPTPTPTPTPTPPPVQKVTLQITIEGNGSVLPGEGTYSRDINTLQMLTVSPGVDSTFEGWFGPNGNEVTLVGSDYSLNMNGNKAIIARFATPEPSPTPTPEPTPTPTPEVNIEPEPIPESNVVLDEPVPLDSPVLPPTGGVPAELLCFIGGILTTSGVYISRFKKKKNR